MVIVQRPSAASGTAVPACLHTAALNDHRTVVVGSDGRLHRPRCASAQPAAEKLSHPSAGLGFSASPCRSRRVPTGECQSAAITKMSRQTTSHAEV